MTFDDPGPQPTPLEAMELDAPLDLRAAWESGAMLVDQAGLHEAAVEGQAAPPQPILFPDDASVHAVGLRAPASGKPNWVPVGPRNVGGRIRSIAIHPVTPNIMFAGAASGGVHRTTDGGESWVPLWHEQASLAVGAIAISRADPQLVWAATGEVHSGGGEVIRGNGIWRSNNGGNTWENPTRPRPVPGAGDLRAFSFDAIAPDPTDANFCWAVGPQGVFRTHDRGVTWHHFPTSTGSYFSDVVFAPDGSRLWLLKVSHFQGNGGLVIRVDQPRAADVPTNTQIDEINPLPNNFVHHQFGVAAGRGKFAVAPSNPDVAYVRWVTELTQNTGQSFHAAMFRATNASTATPANTANWALQTPAPDWTATRPGTAIRFEGQGVYNLCLAVSPRNPAHVATGMIELYVTTNGTALAPNWLRATALDLYHVDRAHHEDHHAAVFDPVANPPALWVGNDGGISVSTDWHAATASYPPRTAGATLPVPANVVTWRKRSHGIPAAQMYDLAQSPVVPSMYGCGFQDNGVHVTSGGDTWELVLTGDGGFVAFDPDDPYQFYATWQEGIAHVQMPGRLEGTLPAAGQAIRGGLWPRVIDLGFERHDGAFMAPEVAYHPQRNGRVLTSRLHRLYGLHENTATDQWQVEPVGVGVDLLVAHATGTALAQLTVLPSTAGPALGLEPQTDVRVQRFSAQARCARQGPYALTNGDQLQLIVNGTPRTIVFTPGQLIANLGSASVMEVCREINRQAVALGAPELRAVPAFWPRPTDVEIVTDAVSTAAAAASIRVAGTALATFGIAPGTYTGAIGHPAVVRLPLLQPEQFQRFATWANLEPAGAPPVAQQLEVQVGARPVRRLDFQAPPFADLEAVRVQEMARILGALLATDGVQVRAVGGERAARITATGGQLRFGGNARTRLNQVAPAIPIPANANATPGRSVIIRGRQFLTGAPPRRLVLNDGTTSTTVVFNAATNINDLGNVRPEELVRVLSAAVTAAGVRMRVDSALFTGAGFCSEIAFSPYRAGQVWAGGVDGSLFRSDDGGTNWLRVPVPAAMTDQDRRVEAIAFHPTNADVVYVGLYGERKDLVQRPTDEHFLGTGPRDPGFLFRTDDGGSNWTHIGGTVRDAANNLVSITALVTDPAEPDTLYAATNVGVFNSANRGGAWQPFNEGLPNCRITDMTFEPTTRTLRAGAWGRAVYERRVGAPSARDIRLYLRANDLDDANPRPVRLGPELMARQPTVDVATASPDIKLNRVRPAGIGADELIDGVEFDEDLDHEPPPAGPTRLYLQVHNRGAFVATGVRVVALWTDVTLGIPDLPADFWTLHAAGTLPAAVGAWHRIADTTISAAAGAGHDRVSASDPRVVSFPADFTSAATAQRIGIVALVSHADDPHPGTPVAVADLLRTDRRAAYRETELVPAIDDERLFLEGRRNDRASVFDVAPAPAPSALQRLGINAGVVGVSSLMGGRQTFDLTGGPRGINVTVTSPVVTATFTLAEIRETAPNPPAVVLGTMPALLLLPILNRALFEAGVFAAADLTGPVLAAATRLRIQGRLGALIQVTGGTAAPLLGFAVGAPAAAIITSNPQTGAGFNLTGAPHDLQMQVTQTHTIRFPAARFASPAQATAAEVRAVINDELGVMQFPVRAVVPRVELRVASSVADAGGRRPTTGGAHLADVVVAPQTAAGDRPGLFTVLGALADDQLVNGQNFLYLRARNLGNAPQADARHRLFAVDIDVSPLAITPIGAAQAETLAPGGTSHREFQWDPPDGQAGDPRVVLAIVDHDPDRPLEPPADLANLAALDTFCRRHPNAAYRTFYLTP